MHHEKSDEKMHTFEGKEDEEKSSPMEADPPSSADTSKKQQHEAAVEEEEEKEIEEDEEEELEKEDNKPIFAHHNPADPSKTGIYSNDPSIVKQYFRYYSKLIS